jgi:GrpB-like predicted nucleotidyltransferase (UPF0157 family)
MYLHPPNDEWQSGFEHEKNALILGYEGQIDIFHIGSTAITGLYAKDCLDLLGVVENISEVSRLKHNITQLGYVHKGEYGISGREYFSKPQRKVHLHIFQCGDVEIAKHLNFVKVMQGNIELIFQLNQLKKQLHAKYPRDKESYQNEKTIYYNRINSMM